MLILFKWSNSRRDTAFPTPEIAQAFCNWINTKETLNTKITPIDLPPRFKGYYGIGGRWVGWPEAREFAELFDLEVSEERDPGEQSCMT